MQVIALHKDEPAGFHSSPFMWNKSVDMDEVQRSQGFKPLLPG